MMASADAFIAAHTVLTTLEFVPEIRLHIARECIALWQSLEDATGEGPLDPPFWAFAWVGGLALARYTLNEPACVRGARVLDLGAGSGLGAIAGVLAGATSATAADIDPMANVATRLNAEANGVALTVTGADLLDGPATGFDVILVGDLFYERAMSARVLAFLERAGAGGCTVLTGDPGRSYFPHSRFQSVYDCVVPATRELEDFDLKPATVWRLK